MFLAVSTPLIDISYGIYFGVLTNVLINTFWNSGFRDDGKPEEVKVARRNPRSLL